MKHSKELKKPKLKILSNKVFHTLWDAAQKSDYDEFVRKFTYPLSEDRIDFEKKFDINYNQLYKMLKKIYELANLSFKDILELTGKRKYEISDTFCIPIRTIEEWYTGNNRCPSYIRLMLLNNYYKIDLGKRLITEAEKERRDNKPNTYAPRKIQEKYKQRLETDDEFERKLRAIDEIANRHKQSEPDTNVQELLAKTDYLKKLKGYPYK